MILDASEDQEEEQLATESVLPAGASRVDVVSQFGAASLRTRLCEQRVILSAISH
jgi:hypothetical protein